MVLRYTEKVGNLEVALGNLSRQLGRNPSPEPEPHITQIASSYPLIAFCNQ